MDNSAEDEGKSPVASAGIEIQLKPVSKVRRRLVQSTLIPHQPSVIESKGETKKDTECNVDDDRDGGDVECCEVQGNNKRARRRKEPQIKTPKACKKAKEKSSPESTPDKDATPEKSTKRVPRRKGTPRKNGTIDGKASSDLGQNGDALPQVPNLRLEAKMMAEENLRVFGGKQIHPFFLNRNGGTESHGKTVQRKLKSTTLGPIHVFEREQDGANTLDWRNWNFCENSFVTRCDTIDYPFSSVFECTVESLCFDKFPNVLRHSGSSGLSICHDNLYSNEASAAVVSPNVQIECDQPDKDPIVDYQVDEVGILYGCIRTSDQERVMALHPDCANQLDSKLWTDKYQPKKAIEICGNDDCVKLLSEWLQNWCQRGHQANKNCSDGYEYDIQDPRYNFPQSDSESENISEDGRFNNVLLITGPVGSGKSSAIYACAKEQGFRVIEANASECRNGVAVKEKFRALESQSTLDSQLFQWSQESSIEFQGVDDSKSPTIPKTVVVQEPGNLAIEVVFVSDEEMTNEATETRTPKKLIGKENSVSCSQGHLKPLILFEDVDIVFAEDRGLVSAIQQIADKAKGPIILTCNSDKPVLPDNLDRLELCFKMPLEKELLQHLYMVCSAEKVKVQPHLVRQLIQLCQRDIRKTLMHLQFWCQGRVSEVKSLSNLLQFDLEAAHQILPKIIPWELPFELSELVEKEITISLSTLDEVIEDKLEDPMVRNKPDSIEAKKKAMLNQNPDHEYMDFIDFLDSSSNPFPLPQKSIRRKLVVTSSDSEDELAARGPTTHDKDAGNGLCCEADGQSPSHCLSMQKCMSPSTDLRLSSQAEKLEENIYQCLETSIDLNVEPTCMSVDISCVPESSFVPETEIDDGIKIFSMKVPNGQVGQVAEMLEEASVSNEFRHVLAIDTDKFDESMVPKLPKDSDLPEDTCDVTEVPSREEVEDSQNQFVGSVTREYQLMDEYSCIDFSRKVKLHDECKPSTVTDRVRDSWRRLRDRRGDLRHLVATDHKSSSGIMKFARGLCNLISEAELLHTKPQLLDSLGVPIVYTKESDAFSWHDEQYQMASAILEHGFCFYAKNIAAAGTDMGPDNWVDLKKVASSPNLGGSLGQNRMPLDIRLGGRMNPIENATPANSEKSQHLLDIIQSMVPSRACMSIRGNAFCEYLSSLGSMARSEAARLSEGITNTKRRRGRAARNYLSTGSLMLSPDEISLLSRSNIYGKISNPRN